MNKFSKWVVNNKIVIICSVLIITVISALLMSRVIINYNNADYLPDDTDTAIGLKIMADEFGLNGNILVMVSDIDEQEANSLYAELGNINNIQNISFNVNSTDYYVDRNALYVIMIDENGDKSTADSVYDDIQSIIDAHNYSATYGGSSIEKIALIESITTEITYILIVCVALATIILMMTSTSWIEPMLFLFVSGIGIIINRGSNIIFGEVSYITNSVAAILQLALSMDYGIVLLHTYHEKQKIHSDNKAAMQKALVATINPVSASALTTVAGLMALLFMTFKVGFDIGIVLSKGIIISAILAFTLLPVIILIFNNLMEKTKKKRFVIKSSFLTKIATKRNLLIITVALVIIIVGSILRTFNSYSFTDSKLDISKITDNFSYNNSLVVLYKNEPDSELIPKQDSFYDAIKNYKVDDKTIVSSYTAYNNTLKEPLTVKSLSDMLNVDNDSIKELFALYSVYNNSSEYKMNFQDFILYTDELVKNNSDMLDIIDDEDAIKVINLLSKIYGLSRSENTYSELYYGLQDEAFSDYGSFDSFFLQQAYGLYNYDHDLISTENVDFKDMLAFLIDEAKTNSYVSDLIDSNYLTDLETLSTSIDELLQPLTKTEFQAKMLSDYATTITDTEADVIFDFYFNENNIPVSDTIPFINIMNLLNEQDMISDPAQSIEIDAYYQTCVNYIEKSYGYDEFITALKNTVLGLTSTSIDIEIPDEAVQQLYIIYLYQNDMMPDTKILGGEFFAYLKNKSQTNSLIGENIDDDTLKALDDFITLDNAFTDANKYDYKEMNEYISNLENNISSISANISFDDDILAGVYALYQVDQVSDFDNVITADDLISFLTDNIDKNVVIDSAVTPELKADIEENQKLLEDAKKLLIGNEYSRMIINVDLPTDSDDSFEFANYLSNLSKETFGPNTYVAGEIMSTKDLRDSFQHDVLLISIMSALAILIIIMIIYQSISLPLLLVVIIQGSIWISMSTFFISGNPMFFLSYIVANCILMGATIDYGILVSSKYLESRRSMDKIESINNALSSALPSIFTSGLILVVCGLTVFFVSTQRSISTVGLLLGIGTTTSLLMVLFALPSFLLVLDKIIMKTTKKTK